MSEDRGAYLKNLIRRCKEGDNHAWHELIDLVGPVIFAQCRRSNLTRDESFDIFGRVSYQLVNSIESLKSPEKILSFVATIARRQIYDFFQSLKIVDYFGDQSMDSVHDDSASDPEKEIEITRLRQVLLEAMSTLSERDCKLVKMLFFDPKEPSYKEISEKLKMPVSSIGPIRAKILARLYKVLKKTKWKFWVFSEGFDRTK